MPNEIVAFENSVLVEHIRANPSADARSHLGLVDIIVGFRLLQREANIHISWRDSAEATQFVGQAFKTSDPEAKLGATPYDREVEVTLASATFVRVGRLLGPEQPRSTSA